MKYSKRENKVNDIKLDDCSFDEINRLLNNKNLESEKEITKFDFELKNSETLIHPQVLDNDVENFKINLETILSKFKLESINQIMITKNKLLEEQKIAIKNSELKNKNIIYSKENDISEYKLKIHNLEEELYEYKNKFNYLENKFKNLRNVYIKNKKVGKYFYKLKNQKENNKLELFLNNSINKIKNNKIKYKIFSELKNLGLKRKIDKKFKIEKINIKNEFENLIFKMKEDNENLKYEFKKTQERLNLEIEAKNNIQKKLKSAFIKGINAMNMEAMNSLNIENILDNDKIINNNIVDNNEMKNNNIVEENNFTKNFEESNKNFNLNYYENQIKKKNPKKFICMNNLKPENKEHLWREAPIYKKNN